MTPIDLGAVRPFNFPDDAPVTSFERTAIRILASDDADLILHLNAHMYLTAKEKSVPISADHVNSRWPTSWATLRRPYPPYTFDVIYVADLWAEQPEVVIRQGLEILESITSLGASVGVVNLPPTLIEGSLPLVQAKDSGNLKFLDLQANLGDYRLAAMTVEARRRAFLAQAQIENYLEDNWTLGDKTLTPGTRVALHQELWQRLRRNVTCDLIVVRDPLMPIGAIATWVESREGSRVISFQHGVVPCLHKYIPILGTAHLTFGPHSANLLSAMNLTYAGHIRQRHAVTHPIGNYVHKTPESTRGSLEQRLLVLDQSSEWADGYYGLEQGNLDIAQLAAHWLQMMPNNQVTVRPHPSASGLENWLTLKGQFGTRVSISHPRVPLLEDVDTATVAMSLFSGAALAAAANRVPTLLLGRQGRPWTMDLQSFSELTLSVEEAADQLVRLQRDPTVRDELAADSFAAATGYFGHASYRPITGKTIAHYLGS